jgi:hypothetical protein
MMVVIALLDFSSFVITSNKCMCDFGLVFLLFSQSSLFYCWCVFYLVAYELDWLSGGIISYMMYNLLSWGISVCFCSVSLPYVAMLLWAFAMLRVWLYLKTLKTTVFSSFLAFFYITKQTLIWLLCMLSPSQCKYV